MSLSSSATGAGLPPTTNLQGKHTLTIRKRYTLRYTADTVLLKAYEESRPAKNWPPPKDQLKFLVQILDLDNTKDIKNFQPFALSSLILRCEEVVEILLEKSFFLAFKL